MGDGKALLAASRERGLEGVIAKRLDSSYEPGKRTGAWLKIKNVQRQEVVIGGWLPGEGRREESIGSLAVGYYDGDDLKYAGNVGTGFKDADLVTMKKLLAPLRRDAIPVRRPPAEEGHGVRRAQAGGGGGVPRVDAHRHPARPLVQGAARRQGPAHRGARGP